jgi:hypothetical protein
LTTTVQAEERERPAISGRAKAKRTVTALPETLLEQASMKTKQYFLCAVRDIDREFGEGYAKAHPELLAAVLEVAAADYRTAIRIKSFEEQIEYSVQVFEMAVDRVINAQRV